MATSEDVAGLAGVSRATVSRVFSGSPRISAATHARVREAAASLGYEPNAVARSLSRGHSRSLALGIFPEGGLSFAKLGESQFYFFMGVLQSIEREAAAQGYDLLLPSQAGTGAEEYVRGLKTRQVAGAIMVALRTDDPRIRAMIEGDIPAVFVDVATRGTHVSYVTSDHIAGSEQATEHLLGLGHRRIAFFSGHVTSLSGTERLLGCHRALQRAGVALDPGLVRQTGFSKEVAYRETLRLLDERRDFTAILASSDFVAFGILRALHERGVRVPGNVSLVGFDDIDLCLYTDPPLTTVRQDPEALGAGAVRHVMAMLGGEVPAPLVVPTELVVRRSTGPAPA